MRKHIEYMSHFMRKQTICIWENKDADQLRGNNEADHAFVFNTQIVQFFYLISSHLLCLCSLVCVGPFRKPHCWFSHNMAYLPFYTIS